MAPKKSSRGRPPNCNIEISEFVSKVRDNRLSLNVTEVKQLLDVVINHNWDEETIDIVEGKINKSKSDEKKRSPGPGRGKTEVKNVEINVNNALETLNSNILDMDDEHVAGLFKLLSNFQLKKNCF